jgi:hypothetical protein
MAMLLRSDIAQRKALAYKHAQIGRSFLLKGANAQEGSKPADAVVWLQRAFAMADQLQDTTDSAIGELKVYLIISVSLKLTEYLDIHSTNNG